MFKLIVFLLLFLIIISSFSVGLGFFVQGFGSISNIFTTFSNNFFSIFENLFDSLFNAPLLSLFILMGLVYVTLRYVISLLGGDKDA